MPIQSEPWADQSLDRDCPGLGHGDGQDTDTDTDDDFDKSSGNGTKKKINQSSSHGKGIKKKINKYMAKAMLETALHHVASLQETLIQLHNALED